VDFEAEYGGANKLRGDGSRRQGFRFSRWRVVRYFALFRGGFDPRLDGGLFLPMDETHEYLMRRHGTRNFSNTAYARCMILNNLRAFGYAHAPRQKKES